MQCRGYTISDLGIIASENIAHGVAIAPSRYLNVIPMFRLSNIQQPDAFAISNAFGGDVWSLAQLRQRSLRLLQCNSDSIRRSAPLEKLSYVPHSRTAKKQSIKPENRTPSVRSECLAKHDV